MWVDAECCTFEEKWRNIYLYIYIFFVEVNSELVVGDTLAVMNKANLKSRYSLKHARLDELQGQMCLDKDNSGVWVPIKQL